jgi:hypothetical protein
MYLIEIHIVVVGLINPLMVIETVYYVHTFVIFFMSVIWQEGSLIFTPVQMCVLK